MATVYVTKSSMPDKEEYYKEIEDLRDSHFLTNMGVIHKQLKADLKEYFQAPYIGLFCNGHYGIRTYFASNGITKRSHYNFFYFCVYDTGHYL